jgi:hypothetical protein
MSQACHPGNSSVQPVYTPPTCQIGDEHGTDELSLASVLPTTKEEGDHRTVGARALSMGLASVLPSACSSLLARLDSEKKKDAPQKSRVKKPRGKLHARKARASPRKGGSAASCSEDHARGISHADSPSFGFRTAINRALATHHSSNAEGLKTSLQNGSGAVDLERTLQAGTVSSANWSWQQQQQHAQNMHSPNFSECGPFMPAGASSYAKEQRASSCFPKQSAREACQGIIDAIQRCNVYLTKKDRIPRENAVEMEERDTPDKHEITLDHILSNVPYKDMLQDLFGMDGDRGCIGEHGDDAATRPLKSPSIPLVTKTYEESFMREPMWEHERLCIMGTNCECNFIGTRAGEGFTAVEFILPSEACILPAQRTRQMCVLCHRRLVQSLFYDIIYAGGEHPRMCHVLSQNQSHAFHLCFVCVCVRVVFVCGFISSIFLSHSLTHSLYLHPALLNHCLMLSCAAGSPFRGVIQRYGNICNQEGEYAREVMLICPPNGPVECMPFPSVSHQRNKYAVYTKAGIKYIKQNCVGWQDFCLAPPSSAAP